MSYLSLFFLVQIEVETVDRTGTFLGSLWESKTNMAVVLLEAGLAKLQTSFGADRIADAHLLAKAEQSAKQQKLKVTAYISTCLDSTLFVSSPPSHCAYSFFLPDMGELC